MRLSKNARLLRPAIRKRWAVVLIAIPPSLLLCFFAPSSTVASGRAQFSHLEQKFVIGPAREAGQQNSLSQSQSQEGASTAPKTSIPTYENLQLTLKADCGNVEVFTDVQNEVSYRVRLDPKTAAEAEALRRNLSFTGRETPRGVVLINGTIRGIAPLSGPPVLARAAMHAVEQWRYVPAVVEGHPVNVVSTVTLAFRLHP